MQTKRLHLRERTAELFEAMLQQSVEQQLAFLGLESKEQLEVEIDRIKERYAQDHIRPIQWDLVHLETKQVIGSCGYHNWQVRHERAEIGYFLHEKFRGKGYMVEAVKCIIDFGFNQMKLNRIEAFVGPDNLPSKKIVVSLGFKEEGLLRQHYKSQDTIYDSIVYGLLRSEFN